MCALVRSALSVLCAVRSLCGVLKIAVDALDMEKVKKYFGVVVIFIFNLFTNIKALQYSNVETVIVFQTLTSLVVAYGDFKLLNSARPSNEVIASLLLIVAGALGYVALDSTFTVRNYFWVMMYFIAKATDMLYTKHIVDTVKMTSWGRSFYNNFLALVPVFIMVLLNGELTQISNALETGILFPGFFVALSCIMGLGISISGFVCREAVSATSFSVVGNMNKVLTVFINFVAWDYHASPSGLLSLAVCVVGGAFYAKYNKK